MSLRDLFTKATKAVRGASAMSHMGGDGKVLKKKFTVVIEQRVRAESSEAVDSAIEKLEGMLQQMGGLMPLIEMCELEEPIITDGLPDVSVIDGKKK